MSKPKLFQLPGQHIREKIWMSAGIGCAAQGQGERFQVEPGMEACSYSPGANAATQWYVQT